LLLGESYVKCGRHIAGLKALQKALELDPANWMAWYDIGEIYVQLATYDKAVEAYEKVQEMTGRKELGVTAAMAVATLALGQQSAAGGFRERSRRAFHSAVSLAAEVLQQGEGHRPWGWKLIGDAAFELANHEPELADAEQSAAVLRPVLELLVADDADRRSTVEGLGLAGNLLQASVDVTFSLKSSVFAYAYRAYLCRNDRTSDSALYDLATALHTLAGRTLEDNEKKPLMKGAISAIRVALEKDAGDERLWNALGVICGQAGPQLAQHAFVVSLELYAKVSTGVRSRPPPGQCADKSM
jgi:superkiller protein 3